MKVIKWIADYGILIAIAAVLMNMICYIIVILKTKNLIMKSIIVYKDGSYIVEDSNSTLEFENDKDWLVTIPLGNEKTKEEINQKSHEYT